MTNIARATLVINETYADEFVKMHMTPPKVAQALADAGLLMPDLPEPDLARDDPQWIADHRETWEADYGDDYETPDVWEDAGPETSLAVFPKTGGRMVHPAYDGETAESVTASEARRIGMRWLAAADYAERNHHE